MGRQLVELANGFSCYAGGELSSESAAEEAGFIYREIFKDGCYDIAQLPEDAFIVDAGANIGLFCLYMKQKYPLSKILAFEPAAQTVATLRQNLELHNISGVETYPFALGSTATTQTLTYYPNLPGNSTLLPAEKDMFREVAKKAFGKEKTDEAFEGANETPVPVKRLSDVLESYADVSSIDLLKIDVEGGELEVLNGISDTDWKKIRNVALEICDMTGQLDRLEEFLRSRGFVVKSELSEWGLEAKMYMLTASRD